MTQRLGLWQVLFLIPAGVVLNNVFSNFSFHQTDTTSKMRENFQKEYDGIMKNKFIYKLYDTFMRMDIFFILISLLLYNPIRNNLHINPVFLALIIIASIYQIRWIMRVLIQAKYILVTRSVRL